MVFRRVRVLINVTTTQFFTHVSIAAVVCKLVSTIFFLSACFFYKPPPKPQTGSENELKTQTEMVNEAFEDDLEKPANGGETVGHESDSSESSEEPTTQLWAHDVINTMTCPWAILVANYVAAIWVIG